MDPNEEICRLLASIDRRLALLTAPMDREVRVLLESELLRTPARIQMFHSIDGKRGSQELAKIGGVTDRAAQQFVKELLSLGLVSLVSNNQGARSVIVEPNHDAVLSWYLRRTQG